MMKRLLLGFFVLIYSLKSPAQDTVCFSDINALPDTVEAFSGYRYYAFGDIHKLPESMKLKLALIKYLNKHEHITDVYLEIGKSAAWLYNQYLATGDTSWITAPKLVFYSKPQDRLFWHQLYEYNKLLTEKIVIHGFDFERMDLLKFMQLQKKTRDYPPAIRETMHYLDTVNIKSVNSDTLAEVVKGLNEERFKHDSEYRMVFGENYDRVREVLLNPVSLTNYARRDAHMMGNFHFGSRKDKRAKFVLFVGRAHLADTVSTNLGSRFRYMKNAFVCNEDSAFVTQQCRGMLCLNSKKFLSGRQRNRNKHSGERRNDATIYLKTD